MAAAPRQTQSAKRTKEISPGGTCVRCAREPGVLLPTVSPKAVRSTAALDSTRDCPVLAFFGSSTHGKLITEN
jgi:hypothetical protein